MHCENRAVGGRDTKILNITQCDYACVSINLCVRVFHRLLSLWKSYLNSSVPHTPVTFNKIKENLILSRSRTVHHPIAQETAIADQSLAFWWKQGRKEQQSHSPILNAVCRCFFSAAAFFSYFLSFFFLFMSDILYNVRLGQQRSCKSMCCDGKE